MCVDKTFHQICEEEEDRDFQRYYEEILQWENMMCTKEIMDLATKLYLVGAEKNSNDLKKAKKFVKTISFRNAVSYTCTAMHELNLVREEK